jgi:hypothetical protein
MTDTHARARVWTLCFYALVLGTLTDPLVALLTPLAPASAPALTILATVLAVALVGGYVALAVLLIVAVLQASRSAVSARAPAGAATLRGERQRGQVVRVP